MPLPTKLVALAACGILAWSVFELVRRKSLREEYSLLWFGVTLLMAVMILLDGLTVRLIHLLGGVNVSSFFFFGGVFFSVMLILHLTVQVSDLKRKQNVLIQEIGLLRQRLDTAGGKTSQPHDAEGRTP